MARPDSWMPVYWKELWADTQHLTAVEQCAYFNLLGSMWMAGGSLADDSDRLQIMARVTAREWRAVAPNVMAFFARENGRITQKRLAEEFAKAMKAYTARSEHIATVNSHRRQRQPTVTVTVTDPTTHNSHSPSGEKASNEALPAKPRKQKVSVPLDWMPNQQDAAHAAAKGLDAQTISNLGEQFRDHHTAKGSTFSSISAAWRTWVGNHINYHGTGPWPRADAGRPKSNAANRGSIAAARDQILAEAGIQPRGNADALRTEGPSWAAGDCESDGGFGPVIDGDFRERGAGPSDGFEGPDATADGADDPGRSRAAQGLSEARNDLPRRRGEACADDTAERERLVACMAGASATIGDPQLPQADDAQGADLSGFKRSV